MSARVEDRDAAAERVRRWREEGHRVALATGDFDLLSVGHVRELAAVAARADRLLVAVRGDRAAAARGPAGRPVLPARDRASLVAALRGVDLVVILEPPAADAPERLFGPHLHAEIAGGPDPAARLRARPGGGA